MDAPAPTPDAREHCLRLVVEQLGPTEVGRGLGLGRIEGLSDLRALVPIRDRDEHQREVEAKLGFRPDDGQRERAQLVGLAAVERPAVVAIWRSWLAGRAPETVALLRGHGADPVVDNVMRDDLQAFAEQVLHIDHIEDAQATLERLQRFDPEVLVVSSAIVCRRLEAVHRTPLDHKLRRLRIILAEYDLRHRLRTRVRARSAGWIARSGRIAIPSPRSPTNALTLTAGSQIVELLPYSNPEEDGGRVYAEQTVLPEETIIGQRYELVLTSPLGFLRMRTGEHVRVVGFDAPTEFAAYPRPRIVRLPAAPADIRLEGCTLPGSWLAATVRQVFHREDPALVTAEIGADPMSIPLHPAVTASLRLPESFGETELAWLARTGRHRPAQRHPRGLLIRVEMQGHVGPQLPRKLADRIDQGLRQRSPAYAYLRDRGDLELPAVQVAKAGTRRAEEERRISELRGPVWVPEVRVIEHGTFTTGS